MRAFTELYRDLDQTTKTNEKVKAMASYFNLSDPVDSIWAVALLTGRRPKRPIKTSDLRRWAAELAGIPGWLFEESYSAVGDLAETVSLLLNTSAQKSQTPLKTVMEEILRVVNEPEEIKKEWLLRYWKSLSSEEIFVFNKLITGSFRVGVSRQLVFRALALHYSVDEKTIAHKLMGNWLPQDTSLPELLEDTGVGDHSKPYPFYLAYQLDVKPEELGEVTAWQIERKYDGIRGQLIARNNDIHVWSRGEELMTDKFIEFTTLSERIPNGTVLDGEVLPYRDDKILSFGEMQKRIGRKNLSKKILAEVPLCMMCYDILEVDGHDIREIPLAQRRVLLEKTITQIASPIIRLSPVLTCDHWDQTETLRNESRLLGCEGLMLKHKESIYESGRRRGKWWKWKVDPYTVDAVLIYAQAGHGRRANLYTDYTFAVWDKGELVPFTKAYSGLTDAEILQVDGWIKKNTIEKFGPVRSVKAELVFEIAFEGINLSSRHKSGIALRFPRIARWRRDKTKGEINTKDDLLQLIQAV